MRALVKCSRRCSMSVVIAATITCLALSGQASADGGPTVSVAPTITGTAMAGQTLTVSSGTWSGSAPISYAYQWEDCSSLAEVSCSPISGATSATYTVQSSDAGQDVEAVVTASNSGGSVSVGSAAVAVGSVSSYVASVQAAGPVAFWQLGDSSLPTAFDASGNGSNATFSSGVTSGMLAQSGVAGSGSLGLTGDSSAYVQIPAHLFPSSSRAFTVQVWFKTSAGPGVLLGEEDQLGQDNHLHLAPVLYVDSSGYVEGQLWWDGAAHPIRSLAPVDDGLWHQAVLATTSAGAETLTIDGAQQGTASLAAVGYAPVQTTIGAGVGSPSIWPGLPGTWTGFGGHVEDVALYNSALSSGTIQAQYNAAGLAPSDESAPAIAGTPSISSSLVASTGTWSGAAPISYTYQWQDCNSAGSSELTGLCCLEQRLRLHDPGHRDRIERGRFR